MWLKPRLLSGARSPLKYPRPPLIPRFHGGGGAGRPRRPRLGQLIAAAETSLPLKFPEGSGRRTCDRPKEPNYFLTRRKRWAGEGDPRHGDHGVPPLELGPQRHLGDPLLAGRTAEGPGQPGLEQRGLTAPAGRLSVTRSHSAAGALAAVTNVEVTVEQEGRGGHVRS